MRVFSIGSDDSFEEYEPTPFEVEHEEAVLQEWLRVNPDGILEDGSVLIIGQEIQTDLGGFIDLLGVDRHGSLVVVELKRDRTPRDVIAQALEYAAYAERLDADALERILRASERDESLSLAGRHRKYFGLDDADTVAFNKDQRIVIVGQSVTPPIRHTARFLGSKGVRVTCVEFTFFQTGEGRRLLSQETVVGDAHAKARTAAGTRATSVTEGEFLEACDKHGRAVFSGILEWAKRNSMSIKWGTGFTVGALLHNGKLLICDAYGPPDYGPHFFYGSL